MTLKESVFAWARRMADAAGVKPHHYIIESDGFVYAMPEEREGDALAFWPLPCLGVDGEAAFASGKLND
jgi:hypothetical protein